MYSWKKKNKDTTKIYVLEQEGFTFNPEPKKKKHKKQNYKWYDEESINERLSCLYDRKLKVQLNSRLNLNALPE